MNEDEKSNTIKSEWTLLLNSFIDENEKTDTRTKNLPHHPVINDDYAKALSLAKHQLYQKIEEIKVQIEETTQIIENLKLVGSSTDDLNLVLDQLHKQGEITSLEIMDIENKIKKIRYPDQSA